MVRLFLLRVDLSQKRDMGRGHTGIKQSIAHLGGVPSLGQDRKEEVRLILVRTKVLFLIALMIQTAVYCVAVYQSMKDYEAWTIADEKFINQMISENVPLPEIRQVFISYPTYILSLQGKLALTFGAALASSWIILGVSTLLGDREKTA